MQTVFGKPKMKENSGRNGRNRWWPWINLYASYRVIHPSSTFDSCIRFVKNISQTKLVSRMSDCNKGQSAA
uniref:Uncharacterized protein n=1 Tax=Arundo donax TaxID=35708 RepID=A0A0A9GSL4_ARUDO